MRNGRMRRTRKWRRKERLYFVHRKKLMAFFIANEIKGQTDVRPLENKRPIQ